MPNPRVNFRFLLMYEAAFYAKIGADLSDYDNVMKIIFFDFFSEEKWTNCLHGEPMTMFYKTSLICAYFTNVFHTRVFRQNKGESVNFG